ncbi:hypothetical protein BV133_2209 [Blastochloris viridis]|uniref:Uncharacterized protein n=1 Tax=Blastochloris viridis TaxID=1079 RepID=A0A182D4W7_BLAVI|nr:hypothetical protein BV133_2209 [Blastochloris viridis]
MVTAGAMRCGLPTKTQQNAAPSADIPFSNKDFLAKIVSGITT